jgi:hypothetical protein
LPEGPHAPKKKINIKKKKNGGGSNVKIVHSNSVTLWRLSAEYQIYFLSLRMIKVTHLKKNDINKNGRAQM